MFGKVEHSVLFSGAVVEDGATVTNSIVLPYSVIKKGAIVDKAVDANSGVRGEKAVIGSDDPNIPWVKDKMCSNGITWIGDKVTIGKNVRVGRELMIEQVLQGENVNE